MSIIYDALKKAETDKNIEVCSKERNNLLLRNNLVIAIIILLIGAIFALYFRKDELFIRRKFFYSKGVQSLEQKKEKPPLDDFNKIKKDETEQKMVLHGIIYDKDNPVALINGKRVMLKDNVEGFEVIGINEKGVVLKKGEESLNLYLE